MEQSPLSMFCFNQLGLCSVSIGILSEDKQTRNLVSFDPANFEMSKIYQGNFQSSCCLAQLFPDTSAVILRKKSEIVGENIFQL